MTARRAFAVSAITLASLACSREPRIESNSSAACSSSLKLLNERASKSKDSSTYASAMLAISGSIALKSMGTAMSGVFAGLAESRGQSVPAPALDSAMIIGSICDGLAGATQRDIVGRSDSLKGAVEAAFDKRYSAAYLTKLREAKSSFARVRDSISAFSVEAARLEQSDGFLGLETVIVMTVMNRTTHTIKRAYFEAESRTEGREVPWIAETFNHSVPGGLAPGERVSWRLTPNMFQGAWSKVRVPREAILKVTPVRLEGPDDSPLWGGVSFGSRDQRLLDSLEKVVKRK